ncbi:MAG: hypothetical protein P3A30_03650 [Gemmatimonadota bacterium]|nr:hypothetical protein [Gemmatimonadota bacterium]
MSSAPSELRFLVLGSLLVLAFMGLLEQMDFGSYSSDTLTPRPSTASGEPVGRGPWGP